ARLPDGEDFDTALSLLTAPAVFLPAILRKQRGKRPIAPDSSLSQAADILRMLTGKLPTREQTAALDTHHQIPTSRPGGDGEVPSAPYWQ
ncbi:hypothetical protein ACC676_38680, partial [Rhizobium ruizarguesonis]